eukprot:6571288-Prorocentrum_lima.AAC.1
MTSSLVGSEMCIRDRAKFETRTTADKRRVTTTQRIRALIRVNLEILGSVSYTHLTLPTICSV